MSDEITIKTQIEGLKLQIDKLERSFNPLSDKQDKAARIKVLIKEKQMKIADLECKLKNEE